MNSKKSILRLLFILFFIFQYGRIFSQFPEYTSNPYSFSIPEEIKGFSFFTVDLNGDGKLDYTFRSETKLYAYNHYGSQMWNVDIAYPGIDVNNHGTKHGAADIDGDGTVEVVAIDTNTVYIFNGSNGNLKDSFSVSRSAGQILGHVVVVNLRGEGDRDAIVQTIDRHEEGHFQYYINRTLIAINLENKAVLWRVEQNAGLYSPVSKWDGGIYEGYFGPAHSALMCADIDLDGRDEVIGGSMVDEYGNVHDPGYFFHWRRWVNNQGQKYIDHIDAISVGDFRTDLPGLEWVIVEEDHVAGMVRDNYWHTIMLTIDQIVWMKETELFPNDSNREPQNVAIGDFSPEKPYTEIWNRSRFEINHTHEQGLGQHPWVYDAYGNQFAHYGTENTLPEDFTFNSSGNAEGIEIIWTIDWMGGPKDYIAGIARHQNGNIGIFDAVTGDSIWTTIDRDSDIQAQFIYVADVAGDSREELITCDVSGSNPLLKIFWNNQSNSNPKPSKWNDPLYRRLKQNWNYYSPGSYTSHEKMNVTITTDPPGLSIIVDELSYTTPKVFNWDENSQHTISTPATQEGITGNRYVFESWSDGGERSHDYVVQGEVTLTATLSKQYYLTVASPYGTSSGTGWYDENSTADFSINASVIQGNSRHYFSYWSGDYSGTGLTGSITMNSPKSVIANWDSQFYLTVNSSHGNPMGAGWYNDGVSATFSVTSPDEDGSTRYIFDNWTGAYSGTSTTGNVIMNSAKVVTANWMTQYLLTTYEQPDEGGNMSPPPPGKWFKKDSTAILSASAEFGYKFTGWSGSIGGNDNPSSVSMITPRTVYANFGKIVAITINSNPSSLKFYADDSLYTAPHTFSWAANTIHEIEACSPQEVGPGIQYVFSSWSDEGTKNHDYRVPDADHTLTIDFKTQYFLTINSSHGNPQGQDWYDQNTTADFSVTTPDVQADVRYIFNVWSGSYSGSSSSGSIEMDGPKTITALWNTEYYLTVNSEHGNPQGEDWYGKDLIAIFSVTSPVENGLTKYLFDKWTGDYEGTSVSGAVIMDSAKAVTAHWQIQYYLSTSENPDQGGNITPSPPGGWYDDSTNISFSANAEAGYKFTGWSGGITGNSNPVIVTILNPLSISANFGKEVEIAINTNPQGLKFSADEIIYTAPQTFTWIENSGHQLELDSPQMENEDVRYVFESWSNEEDKDHVYTVPSFSESLYANFTTQYFLKVNSDYGNPQGAGWYSKDSSAIYSVARYHYFSDTRFAFLKWSGDCENDTSIVDTLIMDSPKEVIADWEKQHYLSVEKSGFGEVEGEDWYKEGTEAVFSIDTTDVTAKGDSQYVFIGWTGKGAGSYTGANVTDTVTMNNPIKETANWQLRYAIRTSAVPSWAGTVTFNPAGGWYKEGSAVSVSAVPDTEKEYVFSYWSGGLSGTSNPAEIIIDGPKDICAHFIIEGEIVITSEPEGLLIIVDGESFISPQQFNWISGSSHTLGVPESYHKEDDIKYIYNYWSDSGERVHDIIVNNIRNYTAFFITKYYLSTYVVPPQGGVMSPAVPGGWFGKDSTVSVQIEPASGFHFLNWDDALSGSDNPEEIVMNAPKKVTAEMEEITGIEDDMRDYLPGEFVLNQNNPNPFNPETIIKYSIPENAEVKIAVYNTRGQQIKILVHGLKTKGAYITRWNSRDDYGNSVSSGIYFYILQSGSTLMMKKCILLR